MLQLEFDNSSLGDIDRLDGERRSRVRKTMADLTRPRDDAISHVVADEIMLDRYVMAKHVEERRIERRKEGKVG